MLFDDEHTIAIKWDKTLYVEDGYREPDDFVYQTKGSILLIGDMEEEKELIGNFNLYYLDAD